MFKKIRIYKINYEIIKKHSDFNFKTRKEKEIEKFIKTKVEEETNPDKLRYLYFECFGKREENLNKTSTNYKKWWDCCVSNRNSLWNRDKWIR